MRNTENSILIDLTAAEVFQYATDPTYLSKWLANEKQTLVAGDGPFENGFTYQLQTNGDKQRRTLKYSVITFESPNSFTVKTSGRLLTYSSHLTFRDENGKTRLTDQIEMENPPGLLNLLGGFFLGRVKNAHLDSLIRLKDSVKNQS